VKADAIRVLDVNESSAEDGQAKPRIQSAVRTISILLAVADSPNGLKAKEIMEKLGLSRQVTYHLVHTMHGTGIIRKNDSNRYVLGLATVSIAEGFSRQLAPPEHLARRVRSIVAATGEKNGLRGWLGGWRDRCPCHRPGRIPSRGSPGPPGLQRIRPCAGSGKIASGHGRRGDTRSLPGKASSRREDQPHHHQSRPTQEGVRPNSIPGIFNRP